MPPTDPDRFLALDFGERRVGLAAGSRSAGAVRALEVWQRPASGEEAGLYQLLRRLVREEQTGVLVVGLALNMDGSEGPRAAASRDFARRLARALRQCEVRLHDERLSSFEADEWMESEGLRKSKRKERRDAYAAAVILRDYFRALDHQETKQP